MKTFQIIIIALSILLAGCILFVHYEIDNVQMSTKQKEIDHLKKQNEKEKDSLQSQLAIKQDSLNIVLQLISVAHQESVEARQRSQKTIENLKRIIFIRHTDSSRTAELKTLYKSYTP